MKAGVTFTSPSAALSTLWLFFVLVFCWTWFFWILAAALAISALSPLGVVLEILGLLGPMLGGITFAHLTLSREGRLDYWLRIIDAKRIRPEWWLVIVLFPPGLFAIALLLDVAVRGSGTLELIRDRLMPFVLAPGSIPLFLLQALVYGRLPEELGWRGYALVRLEARWNALVSSLILGTIWALWHVPLFFIKDTLFYSQGAGSPWFWQFLAGVIAFAVIFTWVFNNTRRSTLAAIVLHFMANLAAGVANVTADTNLYSTLLWIVAAVGVVILWGPGSTARRRDTSTQ